MHEKSCTCPLQLQVLHKVTATSEQPPFAIATQNTPMSRPKMELDQSQKTSVGAYWLRTMSFM